jgi:formylglycine-generating enzyme required for sulfatase activity
MKPIDLRHPFLFYIGHLPAFAWNRYHSRLQLQDALALPPSLTLETLQAFGKLFERGMDPDADDPTQCHWHSQVPEVADDWPPVSQVAAYRDYIRQDLCHRLQRWFEASSDQRQLAASHCHTLIMVIAEHEWMHTETLLYMVHQLGAVSKRPFATTTPLWGSQLAPDASGNQPELGASKHPLGALVSLESDGVVTLGRNSEESSPSSFQFVWDNEMPQVQRKIPRRLQVQMYPVTNRQYLDFVRAGGYRDPYHFWHNESDRVWCVRNRRQCPQFWQVQHRPASDQDMLSFHAVHLDGRLSEHAIGDPGCSENDWPVYVSLAEARAYANWISATLAGCGERGPKWRLPTEAEWQYLAQGAYPETLAYDESPAPPTDGNHSFRRWGPINTYQSRNSSQWKVRDLVGNGWEWTDTPFEPLDADRFQPTSLYPEYSADFFDQKHFVLKGASWATGAPLIRPTFRNWYQAHYPYVFAKFRLVRDIS